MMRHVSCILLLEGSTTSQRLWVYRISVPYAQKDPRFLFEKRYVSENSYAEHKVTGKTYNKKKIYIYIYIYGSHY